MIPRDAETQIQEALLWSPAVALLGPRQSGKTTLAKAVAAARTGAIYLDLERADDRARLRSPADFLGPLAGRLVVIDEVHRAPGLFEELRGEIDARRQAGHRAGQFLILGSASMALLRQSSETLAGRIAFVDLRPLSIRETLAYDPTALDTLWLRGGFPESFLASSDKVSLEWRRHFIRTYLERDIQQFGGAISPSITERLWTMLAHAQGGLLNASRLAKSCEVSSRTIGRYIDLLEGLLLVRALRPWRANAGKRVVASPKLYLRDSGIVHALLNIENREELFGHPVVGTSWEGLVIESIINAAPPRATPWFYRTSAGTEIDLILELAPGRLAAFEIKRSLTPNVARGLLAGCVDISAVHRFLVYPGPDQFAMGNGVTALPVGDIATTVAALK
jgi:uncharacterized protein